jgi:hypothetical protein
MLFGFIYPSERERAPEWVIEELQEAVRGEGATEERVCRGTLLSKYMYVTPVDHWGFEDVRLAPRGILTPEDVAHFVAV